MQPNKNLGFIRLNEVAIGLKLHFNIGLYGVAWGSMKLHEVEIGLKLRFIGVGYEITFYCLVA